MNDITKTYIVSDTHFDHALMEKYCGRPKNFTDIIISQWRATVQSQDIVLHIGDVIWGSRGRLSQVMSSLPGTKILIKGNHDRNHSNNWFIQAGFAAVFEKVQISGCVLSHFPAVLNQAELDRGIINIFGHFHNNSPKHWEPILKRRITPNHYLFSLEHTEYKPVDLAKIKRGKIIQNALKLLESER